MRDSTRISCASVSFCCARWRTSRASRSLRICRPATTTSARISAAQSSQPLRPGPAPAVMVGAAGAGAGPGEAAAGPGAGTDVGTGVCDTVGAGEEGFDSAGAATGAGDGVVSAASATGPAHASTPASRRSSPAPVSVTSRKPSDCACSTMRAWGAKQGAAYSASTSAALRLARARLSRLRAASELVSVQAWRPASTSRSAAQAAASGTGTLRRYASTVRTATPASRSRSASHSRPPLPRTISTSRPLSVATSRRAYSASESCRASSAWESGRITRYVGAATPCAARAWALAGPTTAAGTSCGQRKPSGMAANACCTALGLTNTTSA